MKTEPVNPPSLSPDFRSPLRRSKVPLKDPTFAAVLAFLVPGLGHLYQRRIFKGLLYLVCILGTFAFGMRLGDGKVVYFNWDREKRTWAYLCQFWVGLPALPALTQVYLRDRSALEPNQLDKPISASFTGFLEALDQERGTIVGKISLGPSPDAPGPRDWRGDVTGTYQTPDGQVPISGQYTDFSIAPKVGPDRGRRILGHFEGKLEGGREIRGRLSGEVPRSFWDSYEAPLQDRPFFNASESTDLERAHFELGMRFELGVVYTMIAGLLNILAIYDALEGPAYEDDDDPANPPADPDPRTAT